MQIIAALLVSVALLIEAAPVCRVGSGANAWSGSLADLATIEAVHQRQQASEARQAYPQGAPEASPWSALVTCAA